MKRYTFFGHLNKVNMSYFEHMKHSVELSKLYFGGSVKALVHAVYPDLFETSSTDIQKKNIR
tara:strand:- start:46 stop:231 length:186 start_codon:yes stop_codon:yes gene_type:complete